MPAPATGIVRVYANAGVGGMRALRWNDLPAEHEQLQDWLAAGLVSLSGPQGESPPAELPQGCCGDNR